VGHGVPAGPGTPGEVTSRSAASGRGRSGPSGRDRVTADVGPTRCRRPARVDRGAAALAPGRRGDGERARRPPDRWRRGCRPPTGGRVRRRAVRWSRRPKPGGQPATDRPSSIVLRVAATRRVSRGAGAGRRGRRGRCVRASRTSSRGGGGRTRPAVECDGSGRVEEVASRRRPECAIRFGSCHPNRSPRSHVTTSPPRSNRSGRLLLRSALGPYPPARTPPASTPRPPGPPRRHWMSNRHRIGMQCVRRGSAGGDRGRAPAGFGAVGRDGAPVRRLRSGRVRRGRP